jgi:CDP-glucose 4,6-dehydratase
MTDMTLDATYADRHVFLTGHTGFKGAWMCLWLQSMGTRVTGFSKGIPTQLSAFDLFGLAKALGENDLRGEISDAPAVLAAMEQAKPSVVFHLAAQPIVRAGFTDPYGTFQSNVMGTVAVLEACRKVPSVKAVVVITSDKVYDNTGSPWGFRETDPLGGHEPYGASKAAAEIVAMTYQSAGFHQSAHSQNVPKLATARAGNVVGGGDWAADRLLPDMIRAISKGEDVHIRSPNATRPWQHVLEPLGGYLMLGQWLLEPAETVPTAINFGPSGARMLNVGEVATQFLDIVNSPDTKLVIDEEKGGGEAKTLRVDSGLAADTLGWEAAWSAREAIERTAHWYRAFLDGNNDLRALALQQLADYRSASPVNMI